MNRWRQPFWLLCASFFAVGAAGAGERAQSGDPVRIVERLNGRKEYFELGCFRCHATYPQSRQPVSTRFRAAHDPTARDYLPDSLQGNLLAFYAESVTDGEIRMIVEWADAARAIIERGPPLSEKK